MRNEAGRCAATAFAEEEQERIIAHHLRKAQGRQGLWATVCVEAFARQASRLMTTFDVLQRSIEAQRRVSRIDEEIELLRHAVWAKGHGFEATPKNGILDPMRHVCEMMDSLQPLEEERALCIEDVEEGRALCRGVAVLVSATSGAVLEHHFCDGLSVGAIASSMHHPKEVVQGIVASAPSALDCIGAPRLLQAGRQK